MIKSILDTGEENKPEAVAEKVSETQPTGAEMSDFDGIEDEIRRDEAHNIFEIPEDARFFAKPTENESENNAPAPAVFEDETPTVEILKNDAPVIENLSAGEQPIKNFSAPETDNVEPTNSQNFDSEPIKTEPPVSENSQPTIFQTEYQPESTAETIRNSGMAYTAAIVLVGAVVFMMILGWFVGQLIGNATLGIVGGIIIGAIIGFIQFFRITSSIFKK